MAATNVGIGELAAALHAQAELGGNEPTQEWRRTAERRLARVPVEIECPDGRIARAHAVNISPDSMCVLTKQRLCIRVRVRVRLAYTDGAVWHAAEVIHCTDTLGGFKIGLA